MAQKLPPIMGISEVASYANVSRQLAKKWTMTWTDWPEPFAVLAAGSFWQTPDVKAVLKRHEREPGQGPRPAGDPRPPSVAAPAAPEKRTSRRAKVVR